MINVSTLKFWEHSLIPIHTTVAPHAATPLKTHTQTTAEAAAPVAGQQAAKPPVAAPPSLGKLQVCVLPHTSTMFGHGDCKSGKALVKLHPMPPKFVTVCWRACSYSG